MVIRFDVQSENVRKNLCDNLLQREDQQISVQERNGYVQAVRKVCKLLPMINIGLHYVLMTIHLPLEWYFIFLPFNFPQAK